MPSICGRVCPQEQQCEKNCAHAVRGEAVGIGTHEELMKNCDVYREIATSQLSAAELA